jgi:predicted GIY-YIG superfamily endonuclease
MPFFCYLLRSVETLQSNSCYIGFTIEPFKRLRQHNGELVMGAKHTLKRRPWVHVAVISGFPNKIVALQFEWQWQHPQRSRILKRFCKGRSFGTVSRLSVLAQMLTVPLWKQLNLVVFFTEEFFLKKFVAMNSQVKVQLITTEDMRSIHLKVGDENRVIRQVVEKWSCGCTDSSYRYLPSEFMSPVGKTWACPSCSAVAHVCCTAAAAASAERELRLRFTAAADTTTTINSQPSPIIIPECGSCFGCGAIFDWSHVISRVCPMETTSTSSSRNAAAAVGSSSVCSDLSHHDNKADCSSDEEEFVCAAGEEVVDDDEWLSTAECALSGTESLVASRCLNEKLYFEILDDDY